MNIVESIKNFFSRTKVLSFENMPFFVYGTLRPGEGNYSWALAGETVNEIDGFLAGTSMYSNGGFPYVFEHTAGQGVKGTLMFVAPNRYTEVMRALDSLEGTRYGEDNGDGMVDDRNHYNRVIRLVQTDKNTYVRAWVYMPPEVDVERIMLNNTHVTSGDWFDRPAHEFWTRRRRTYGGSAGISDAEREEIVAVWDAEVTAD